MAKKKLPETERAPDAESEKKINHKFVMTFGKRYSREEEAALRKKRLKYMQDMAAIEQSWRRTIGG